MNDDDGFTMTNDEKEKALAAELEKALAALPSIIDEARAMERRIDVDQRIIRLTREEVTAEPYQVWNAFITLVYHLPFDRMTEVQRSAHLALRYDGEVQNGGHHQFFTNAEGSDGAYAPESTVTALRHLSLSEHAELLQRACARWRGRPRRLPTTKEEFCEGALEEEFSDADREYHRLQPTITDALQSLLERRQDEFVRIDP